MANMSGHRPVSSEAVRVLPEGSADRAIRLLQFEAKDDAMALRWLADWLVNHDAVLIQLLMSPGGVSNPAWVFCQATIDEEA